MFFLLACVISGDKADDTASNETDADTDTDSDTDTDTDGCVTVNPGDDWAWAGECPQMNTPVVISVDGCELTLDYEPVGGMTMGMPFSGTVVGDQVTFADDDSVTGCTGTVTDADHITGTCGDGCTYRLHR